MVAYASLPHVLIHTVLAPRNQLEHSDLQRLDNDFVRVDQSWLIEHSTIGSDHRVSLSHPFDRDPLLAGGETLLVRRQWAGSDSITTEVSQRLVPALELHYVDERRAYCRLDAHGDFDDVIKVVDTPVTVSAPTLRQ